MAYTHAQLRNCVLLKRSVRFRWVLTDRTRSKKKTMHGQYYNESCTLQKCESWCICGRCTQCQTRCLCRCCLPHWKGWTCPRNQSRLNTKSTYRCRHVRSGFRFADTWTTRKSLLGIFGRNFETFRTVYSADKKWEFASSPAV